jgi:hypothetical protein
MQSGTTETISFIPQAMVFKSIAMLIPGIIGEVMYPVLLRPMKGHIRFEYRWRRG